jgi:acetylornithine deacetylase/succinyl-diaminopimelate desuccinylase-like protein
MNIKEKFLQLTAETYPHGYENELVNHLPESHQKDQFGNYYLEIGDKPTTMFTCHLDTASQQKTKVHHIVDGNWIKTNGTSILGADDKAGMVVLLEMIKEQVPGLYYFFIGEERGCVGSGKLSEVWEELDWSSQIKKCISFDRRGTTSVITEQIYGVCCSNKFAEELSNRLNALDETFNYKPDPTGIYTDSAQFTGLISECTNISVGYYNEHSTSERQDIEHLEKLCQVVTQLDWNSL